MSMSRAEHQPHSKPEGAAAPAGCSFARDPAAGPAAGLEGAYRVRRLENNDLTELFALHRKIIDCLPKPELYLAKDHQYFERRLAGDFESSTFILGAFCEESMIAYSSVRFFWYEAKSPALLVVPTP